MKKLILFAAILFVGVSLMKAETPKKSTLTVKLKPFQELIVTGNSVIEYNEKNHYTAGTSVEETGAERTVVTVSSAGGFAVSVTADDLIEEGRTDNVLPAEHILVTATAQDGAIANKNSESTLANLKSAATLISTENGGLDMIYNLAFRATGGEFFRTAYDKGSTNTAEQVYTTTITYTIAAQ